MTQIISIQLDKNTVIYVEATEGVNVPLTITEEHAKEEKEVPADKYARGRSSEAPLQQIAQNFHEIQNTIRAYTVYTLNTFKTVAIENIDKVTLEFGIELGGEAGIPYVTKGTAKSNLKLTVECSFPKETEQPSQPNKKVQN